MKLENAIARYRKLYAKLLRWYPKSYRERFGEGMEQTFNDLCRERQKVRGRLFAFALWMCVETFAAIIRENIKIIFMQNITKRLMRWVVIIAFLLLIPLVLTIRDGGVEGVGWNWTFSDFVVMGSLMFGSALTYELIARKMSAIAYRIAVGLAVMTSLLLVWINAAVGIIGDGPVNLMYFGVLAVGLIVASMTRFRPEGMARALFATAFAQAMVAVIALTFYTSAKPEPLQILALNGFFVLLFVGSALLFRHAARQHGRPAELVKPS